MATEMLSTEQARWLLRQLNISAIAPETVMKRSALGRFVRGEVKTLKRSALQALSRWLRDGLEGRSA